MVSTMLRNFLDQVYMYVCILFLWIPSARLQCSSGTALQVACHGLQSNSVLLTNNPGPVTITCPNPGQNGQSFTGWSLSPGGGGSGLPLDTSPTKYTVINGNSLTISNITGADEGLYSCVYGDSGSERNACIYVYGRAVFASCPLGTLASCANDPTSLSIEDGGSVRFDATVTHTPTGGSCGFQQEATNVRLMKINQEFGVSDELLLSCDTRSTTVTCSNGRVSLSRGYDPLGYDFIFTLANASSVEDAGLYKVDVFTRHPTTSSQEQITKIFSLKASPPLLKVQGLCSVVVWYSPEVSCDEASKITGYEVQLYHPQLAHPNVTSRVGTNGTFYIVEKEKLLANNMTETYIQVRVIRRIGVGEWSEGVSLGCDLEKPTPQGKPPRVYFELNGNLYLNNSAVALSEVGEGEKALLCKTDKKDCCGTVPNRFGQFYFPGGLEQVPIAKQQQGFYRNRGDQSVGLNRREGVMSPTGTYRCEIPNADDEMVKIYITLTGK